MIEAEALVAGAGAVGGVTAARMEGGVRRRSHARDAARDALARTGSESFAPRRWVPALYERPAATLETKLRAIEPSVSSAGLKIVTVIPTAPPEARRILNSSLNSEKLSPPSIR